jgi:hypothetical protein
MLRQVYRGLVRGAGRPDRGGRGADLDREVAMRMRALTASGLAVLIAVMSLATTAQQAEAHRYRGVGWGIAAGVATGIIISQAYRPYYYPRARYYGYGYPGYGYYGYPGYVYRNYGYSNYDDYDYYESRPYRVFRPYSYYSPYRAYRVRSHYRRPYHARRAYYRRHR